ncbi:MAG: amino acid-binding protein [Gammaproteobacteria bacterium]|nr:amino acid-binding protein [Gammaproteobacteria bacterium]
MKQWYMLTLVGEDRAGIVAAVTRELFNCGSNLGEAAMVRLGGNFSVMLMVEYGGDPELLQQALSGVIERFSLNLHLMQISGELHHHLEPNLQLTVYGADRTGIVAEVTAALAENGFHILDMRTDVAGSSSEPIYVMQIEGFCSLGVAELLPRLKAAAAQQVEIALREIDLMIG